MILEHRDPPKLWGLLALDLKHAADILWTRGDAGIHRTWNEVNNRKADAEVPAPQPGADTLAQAHGLIDAAEMLLGLAIENIVKGILIARDPSLIKEGTPNQKLLTHQIVDRSFPGSAPGRRAC